MNAPKPFPRIRKGDPISAEWANAIADAMDRRRMVEGIGVAISEQPTGTIVAAIEPEVGDFLQVNSGGITAFNASTKVLGKGTCRLWLPDWSTETLVDSGLDLTVYNNMPAAVTANRWGQLKYIRGRPAIDVASCT